MHDRDSYLWKCTLDAIDSGMKAEHIQEFCQCSMGLTLNNVQKKIKFKMIKQEKK
tara:strand:- start:148100 stop:148264 length:165 start_codon:yes stop_codon:yes gene_type:complete